MSRPRALVLYARSVPAGLHRSVADTVVSRLRINAAGVPKSIRRNRYVSFWLEDYSSMSYMNDWLEAFRMSTRIAAEPCNLNDLLDLPRALRRINEYELVVVLHSAAGDNLRPLGKAIASLQKRRGPLVAFFGNEYSGMRELPSRMPSSTRYLWGSHMGYQAPKVSTRKLGSTCKNSAACAWASVSSPLSASAATSMRQEAR